MSLSSVDAGKEFSNEVFYLGNHVCVHDGCGGEVSVYNTGYGDGAYYDASVEYICNKCHRVWQDEMKFVEPDVDPVIHCRMCDAVMPNTRIIVNNIVYKIDLAVFNPKSYLCEKCKKFCCGE